MFLLSIRKIEMLEITGEVIEKQKRTPDNARIWIPRLANIAVALNQLILQYLKRIHQRE